jgi:hypothetical protein
MSTFVTFTSDHLAVRPWADDVIDRLGFDPRAPYVERFWLGILGPSTTWLLRRVAAGFDAEPEGFELDLPETARALGLGDRGGRHSPFLRAVNRTVQFGLATGVGSHELLVRRRLPPLARRQVERLSPALQAAHRRWQEAQLAEAPDEDQRRRGRRLALGLVELGEDVEETERQLLRWRYHPALARDAATWAWSQRTEAADAS